MPMRRIVTLTAVAALALAACGGGDDEAEPGGTTTSAGPTAAPTVAPLTGLPIDPAKGGRPALIVKIDNAPQARPQTGLNQADVVFEEMVEGSSTRFATVFHSNDADPVGPVRSARTTDLAIASALNRPLFAYAGANAVVERALAGAAIVNVGVGKFPSDFPRQGGRPAPYNQFSSTSKLFAHAPAGAGPPSALFPFRPQGQPSAAVGAAPATGAAVDFRTKVQYAWDAASGTWKRSHDGRPHNDSAGVQIAPKNVIVQFVAYKDTGQRDTAGSAVPEAQLLGEGDSLVFTDGKVVKGRWRKASLQAATQYLDAAGAPVALTPGQTWVELPPPGAARAL